MFIPFLPPERPVILIFDGHASHLNFATVKEAIKHDVIILKLPSNSMHVLQPLDVGVYGPVKTAWENILVWFAQQNLGMPLNKELFPSLLKSLWQSNCFSAGNIKAGFKRCGVMPWDPTQIPPSVYELSGSSTSNADVLSVPSTSSADVPSSSTDDPPSLL
ncbi:unnamed protein product [Acanthosepion pharaonis]|uniref:DDE-1 domain-containing protein n=1 Tax=Acanthosepion pharaonis TaxID=158019 RepID=A0A812BKU7_ACAPH|nr:unnamed protein product [Sepia pharaonis]